MKTTFAPSSANFTHPTVRLLWPRWPGGGGELAAAARDMGGWGGLQGVKNIWSLQKNICYSPLVLHLCSAPVRVAARHSAVNARVPSNKVGILPDPRLSCSNMVSTDTKQQLTRRGMATVRRLRAGAGHSHGSVLPPLLRRQGRHCWYPELDENIIVIVNANS